MITFATIWLMFLVTSPREIGLFDEGLILTGALRVLSGELPSADFYTNYGPAQFWVLAVIFKVVGNNLLAARIYDALILSLVVVFSWMILKDAVCRKLALLSVLAVITLLLTVRAPLYPVLVCLLLLLLSCVVLLKSLSRSGAWGDYVILALLVAVITLFRYDLGAIFASGFLFSILIIRLLRTQTHDRLDYRPVMREFFGAAFAFGFAIGSTFLLLDILGVLRPAFSDLIIYNLDVYVKTRNLPFPSIRDVYLNPKEFITTYFPLFSITLGLAIIFLAKRSKACWSDPSLVPIMVLIIVVAAAYSKALVRTHSTHMILADVPSIILFAICIGYMPSKSFISDARNCKRVRTIIAFSMALIIVSAFSVQIYRKAWLWDAWGKPSSDLSILFPFGAHADQIAAVKYVKALTGKDEKILSATGRHDKIFINDVSFYYLAQRLPATRWHQYDPGVQTSEKVQSEIIDNLLENNVHILIRNRSWDDKLEPNTSANSSGINSLDEFIDANYLVIRSFGDIDVLRLKAANPS